mgnify:CR=1 FL=1
MKYTKKFNLKIKLIAIIYGVICHSTFFLAGLCMLWVLYNGFTVSFGFGILLVEYLNEFQIGGFPLGFWFSQQGSIYIFVILIFIYIYLMNKLDKKFK